jgi:hypothetical protein
LSPLPYRACERIAFRFPAPEVRHSGAARRAEPGTHEHRLFRHLRKVVEACVQGFRARELRSRPGMTSFWILSHAYCGRGWTGRSPGRVRVCAAALHYRAAQATRLMADL